MNNYYDYNHAMDMEYPTSQKDVVEAVPIKWADIANAGADAVNGSNGAEFCKTIRHGLYCICALSALYLCLHSRTNR